jgi:2-deoxy-D-gluconate 3-dehydrogenase
MSHSLFDLSGETALVTGGAGGIGSALARGLAEAGADLAIADVDLAHAESIKDEIEDMGRSCLLIEADVTDSANCERMVAETVRGLGGLTVLVNNAGTNVRKSLQDVAEEDWDRVVDLNLKSYFFVTRRAGEEMRKAGHGKVINMASLMAWSIFQNPNGQTYGPYAASKGGVVALTRAFAVEWASYNIQVNAICPTFIETPLTRPLIDDPVVYRAIVNRGPIRRFGQIGELVGPCIFLASEASNLVTGTSLMVDGGWYAS